MATVSGNIITWTVIGFKSFTNTVDSLQYIACQGYGWLLTLSPGLADTMSLNLQSSSNFIGVEAIVSLVNKQGTSVGETVLSEDQKRSSSYWVFDHFICKEEILDPNQELLSDGNLTIRVSIFKGKAPHPVEVLSHKMCQDMEQLLEEGDYSDMTLTAEGLDIPCHRVILGSRSPVFKAMIKPHTKESQSSRIEVQGFSPQTVQAMVSFLYTDHLKPGEASVELLNAAEMYQVKGLKNHVERELALSLTLENVVPLFQDALKYKAPFLSKAAIDFIEKFGPSIKRKECFWKK
jgi:hypothetical protein